MKKNVQEKRETERILHQSHNKIPCESISIDYTINHELLRFYGQKMTLIEENSTC